MHIFYCASGKFREVAGIFSLEKHSPNAGHGGIRCWPSVRCIVETQRAFEPCVGASDR